jgi:RND family efflux transporter MFP subunit
MACVLVFPAFAAEKQEQVRPPANVVVGVSSKGTLAPSALFVGSVRFSDTSSVAAESAGKIRKVYFESGRKTAKGSILAVIDSELLEKSIAEAEAALDQTVANLQLAKNDFERTEKLFREDATSEQAFDSKKYNAEALEKQLAAKAAAVANLKAQLTKKTVYSPFDGIVVEKKVSEGEWVNAGSVIADIAMTGSVDIIVNVPEMHLRHMQTGLTADAEVSGRRVTAVFHSVIPAGDTANRTFPVKFRTSDSAGLLEGMEAKISLPVSEPSGVILVNRDAVVKASQGGTFVYTIEDGKTVSVPVKVVGYQGMNAGVQSDGLKEGMQVIVKGNERLKPGQAVNIIGK